MNNEKWRNDIFCYCCRKTKEADRMTKKYCLSCDKRLKAIQKATGVDAVGANAVLKRELFPGIVITPRSKHPLCVDCEWRWVGKDDVIGCMFRHCVKLDGFESIVRNCENV